MQPMASTEVVIEEECEQRGLLAITNWDYLQSQ